MFTTIKSQLDNYYPPLPTNDIQVEYSVVPVIKDNYLDLPTDNMDIVELKWSSPQFPQSSHKYKFCAILTKKVPASTVCSDNKVQMDFMRCVEHNVTSMLIKNFDLNKTSFVTLYVFDVDIGTSSAYKTIQINRYNDKLKDLSTESNDITYETKRPISDKNEILLKDGSLVEGNLAGINDALETYNFYVNDSVHKIETNKTLLILNVCTGYVKLAIYREKHLLRMTDSITGFRRFLIMNAQNGKLTFKVLNDDHQPKTFKIWASSLPESSHYPQLPSDTSIKASRRSCTSVTFQWIKTSDREISYCMYRHPYNGHDLLKEITTNHETPNTCITVLPKANLVGCYTSITNKQNTPTEKAMVNSIIEATVDNLAPGKTYRFEMYASKKDIKTKIQYHLQYRTIFARTLDTCQETKYSSLVSFT
uniref:NDNF_C domain-containing protein n=1 Tax=Rhabditophanes sp. KR3021 TaxID=114890 RepID=A0AC35U6N6_9BILA